MIVDAHHHVWDLSVRDQPWTVDVPILRRSFLLEQLEPDLKANHVDGTIVVQTIAEPEETPELLALAADRPSILGVVGWVDLTADSVADELARLRNLPGGELLVGVRHQVQGESDPRWLLRSDVLRGLTAVADAGLVYELLVTREQLPTAMEVVGRIPGALWVLDHAGRPPIAAGALDPWRDHISALAAHDSVACKLSGLVTEQGDSWAAEDIGPYADHLLAAFGPERLMAGSDWPVCLLAASYTEVAELNRALVSALSTADQARVLGGTAADWYGLRTRSLQG